MSSYEPRPGLHGRPATRPAITADAGPAPSPAGHGATDPADAMRRGAEGLAARARRQVVALRRPAATGLDGGRDRLVTPRCVQLQRKKKLGSFFIGATAIFEVLRSTITIHLSRNLSL